MKAEGGVDLIFAAGREVPAQLCINHAHPVHQKNFQQIPLYENEGRLAEAIDRD